MSLRPNWNTWEGPNLIVTQFCNILKKKGYNSLRSFPSYSTNVEKFRGAPVCMDIAKEEDSDGNLIFLIRGRIPFGGYCTKYDGFLMRSNGTWIEIDFEDKVAENLRAEIKRKSPKLP